VILIERCSGVQVGQDNDQYSVYQVRLPKVRIEPGQGLAEGLLSPDTPWAEDLFSYRPPEVRPSSAGPAAPDITARPNGDTLVIVRNSRGVQVGDHNVQHNQFRIRVAGLAVRADQVGPAPQWEALAARLRDDPDDRGAARSLARHVAEAASIDLTASLTDKITDLASPPRDGWPDAVRDRTGIQVGEFGRASVRVEVRISRWDSATLERQILRTATSLADPSDLDEPPPPPSPLRWPGL
jgi:hypothetical protein